MSISTVKHGLSKAPGSMIVQFVITIIFYICRSFYYIGRDETAFAESMGTS